MRTIPLAKPDITQEDIALVKEVLQSGNLVQGKYCKLLEDKICRVTQSKYASTVSSGTAALHLALIVLDVLPLDEIIVPAFSFAATANVVELVGAIPVFVDIDINTFNIDISQIEQNITSATKGIIVVHEFGMAADMIPIIKLAERHNLFIIEDAACALGTKYNKIPVGSFGNLAAFSFHPRKNITCGEGGILTSQNFEYDQNIKMLRNHGMLPNKNSREYLQFGYNYRLTDFQAALSLSQLKRYKRMLMKRQVNAALYTANLNHNYMILPTIPSYTNHTWQTYHIVLDDFFNRKEIIRRLKLKGIESNYGAHCLPLLDSFQEKYGYNCRDLFPNALKSYKQGLALPMYSNLTSSDIEYICQTLNEVLKNAS